MTEPPPEEKLAGARGSGRPPSLPTRSLVLVLLGCLATIALVVVLAPAAPTALRVFAYGVVIPVAVVFLVALAGRLRHGLARRTVWRQRVRDRQDSEPNRASEEEVDRRNSVGP